jgi:GrpB-like predicted nucleotidyltransferase (UPF0157 family)/chloramphenicol 3-O-phosphotransferase
MTEERSVRDDSMIGGPEERAIVIVPYDAQWPLIYAVHEARIRAVLGDRARRIEHIGSTAVPDLAAKAIVDIQVSVVDPEDEPTYLPELGAVGYELRVREGGHRMLRTPSLDVHVHVCAVDGDWERRPLLFRDWLRRSAADRALYAEAKTRLAERSWPTMDHYAEAKTPVVTEILGRAEAWAQTQAEVQAKARRRGGRRGTSGRSSPVTVHRVGVDAIVLNGGSSAGKSSLARCLQDALGPTWLTLGIDDLIRALPGHDHPSGVPPALAIGANGAVELSDDFRRAEVGWYDGLAAIARSGIGLVIDEVFLAGRDSQERLARALAGLTVLWVGVRCDPEVAAARERGRSDRVVGMARLQAETVHEEVVYDLVVDTTDATAEECARVITARLAATDVAAQGP